MAKRYEVQTYTLCQHWVNCWHENDEPLTFATPEEAAKEIEELISDYEYEVKLGERHPDDVPDRSEFRIVEVT